MFQKRRWIHRASSCPHSLALFSMVGHPFQNYDIVYVGFFAAYNRFNRYVWAFIPYTTIYIAYIRVFNTRICAKSNARLYALLKTRIYAYLSKPTYMRAKMCIYAREVQNQTWYKMARKVPLTE